MNIKGLQVGINRTRFLVVLILLAAVTITYFEQRKTDSEKVQTARSKFPEAIELTDLEQELRGKDVIAVVASVGGALDPRTFRNLDSITRLIKETIPEANEVLRLYRPADDSSEERVIIGVPDMTGTPEQQKHSSAAIVVLPLKSADRQKLKTDIQAIVDAIPESEGIHVIDGPLFEKGIASFITDSIGQFLLIGLFLSLMVLLFILNQQPRNMAAGAAIEKDSEKQSG
jgi:predicted RND superfamily exporter protein